MAPNAPITENNNPKTVEIVQFRDWDFLSLFGSLRLLVLPAVMLIFNHLNGIMTEQER